MAPLEGKRSSCFKIAKALREMNHPGIVFIIFFKPVGKYGHVSSSLLVASPRGRTRSVYIPSPLWLLPELQRFDQAVTDSSPLTSPLLQTTKTKTTPFEPFWIFIANYNYPLHWCLFQWVLCFLFWVQIMFLCICRSKSNWMPLDDNFMHRNKI